VKDSDDENDNDNNNTNNQKQEEKVQKIKKNKKNDEKEKMKNEMLIENFVKEDNKNQRANTYDAFKREPQFCNAHNNCLWEISVLLNHNHPSVRKFA
jgi:hypothetical protein